MAIRRIACISDTHTHEEDIDMPECDAILHAGDITYTGKFDKLGDFCDWGGRFPLRPERKICIAGNHDLTFETDREVAEAIIEPNWTYLQDSSCKLFGMKVWGTPWSPEFFREHWVFNQSRGYAAAKRWALIPEDTEVLIVHGPPHGYGDRVKNGDHVGCRELTQKIEELPNLRLVVCGHIHLGYGTYLTQKGVIVVNAALCDDGHWKGYNLVRPPIVLHLETNE